MQEILDAQAFSLSGCTDDSCAIEVGKLLAAENIVLGELSAIGSVYNLAIRLIDVGSSQTLGAEVVSFASLDEMQEAVFSASYKMAGLKYEGDTSVSIDVAGEIYVSAADDQSLEVFLDGESVGFTPILLEGVPFGAHLVEVKSADSTFTKEVTILSKDIVEVEADIRLLTGNVILTVIPKDAEGFEIKVDNFVMKKGLNKGVPAGQKTIHAEGSGWFFLDEFDIEPEVTSRITIELVAGGYLEILGVEEATAEAVNAEGAVVPVNVNATNTLAPGKYTVTVFHSDYEDSVSEVEIVRDETLKIEQELEYTENYFRRQDIAALEKRLAEVKDNTKFWKGSSWFWGSIAAAGLSVVGTGEYMISTATEELTDLAAQYDAATTQADIDSLGAAITEEEDSIFMWREYRDTAIYIGAPAAGLTLFSVLLAGREARIERKITRLQEAMDEE
ncbi:MAG: PEGA domain-containing protein [Spirochaetales bacterium]|uniref:PEGA domain-containing protein n=1 Tax=Candidatus Thalassospirochaeta sargassi TaxID=3119039 RepID=A0AAJ1IJQ6_9SPIO|nr:PEGA domain-containing protein [Spirochaetales bacterium]